jgi:5-methylcytosine-specific restriction protein B
VPVAPTVKKALEDIFDVLATAGAEFGYRPAYEISRFIYCYAKVSKSDWKLDDAIDASIMQKLLPKLHGSKTKLSPVIEKLKKICEGRYPISSEKLTRMEQRLKQNGFTSYAEA